MVQQDLKCPLCDAPLALYTGQKHCRCPYCSSRFVVASAGSSMPELVTFEDALAAAAGDSSSGSTSRPLAEVETAIFDARTRVGEARDAATRAEALYAAAQVEAQRLVSFPQNLTLVMGFLAAFVWFLVCFTLEHSEWYLGLATAVALTFSAWVFHRRRHALKEQMRMPLGEAWNEVERTCVGVNQALARLEDCTLERELLLQRVSRPNSGTEATA